MPAQKPITETEFASEIRDECKKIVQTKARSKYVKAKELATIESISQAAPDRINDIEGRIGVVLSNSDYATLWSDSTYELSFTDE